MPVKLIHLADLHFGKELHGLSLIREGDQGAWAAACIEAIRAEKPDAVIIAGDVYDRRQPSGEAKELASRFLTALCGLGAPVLMIAGNHDAPEMIDYMKELLQPRGLHVAGTLTPELTHVTLRDADGPVTFWLLPYCFPALVRETLALAEQPAGYTAAVKAVLDAQPINWSERNVLIAHQLVLSGGHAPELGGSETTVGGIGQVDAESLDGFDYVALGHIHKGQAVHGVRIRYAGAPLCYHFDEAGLTDARNAGKGLLVVELGAKGAEPVCRTVPIPPLHPLRNIRGSLETVLADESASDKRNEYLHVTLTDDILPQGAEDQLRAVFAGHGSRLLWLNREPPRRAMAIGESAAAPLENQPLEECFLSYYEQQRGTQPSPAEQRAIRCAAELAEHLADTDTRTAEGRARLAAAAKKLLAFALEEGREDA